MSTTAPTDPSHRSRGWRDWRFAVTSALALWVLDGFVLGQGGLVLVIALIVAPLSVLRACVALLQRRSQVAWTRLATGALWGAAVAATLGTVRMHVRGAKARAERIIAACEAYKAANGAYPASLDALVPGHLPSVPRARYTVLFGDFHYQPLSPGRFEHSSLWFVTVAPFGRSYYVLEQKRWGSLD